MFGYLTVEPKELSEEEYRRYKAVYCGLCRTLRERHGQAAGLTLNYDMSLLVLLLSSLYEPEEETGQLLCVRHPKEKQSFTVNAVSGYAADMTVALSYLKLSDDWHDDGSLAALAGKGWLQKRFEAVKAAYPRQCEIMLESVSALSEIEKQRLDAPDAAADCSGRLLQELFVWRSDRWENVLRAMGHALGRYIYLLDACMDLDRDTLRDRYNPFRRYYGLNNAERFRDILRGTLGECLYWFDVLPLVQDAQLMKNILCSGSWRQFDRKFFPEKTAP